MVIDENLKREEKRQKHKNVYVQNNLEYNTIMVTEFDYLFFSFVLFFGYLLILMKIINNSNKKTKTILMEIISNNSRLIMLRNFYYSSFKNVYFCILAVNTENKSEEYKEKKAKK